MGAWFDPDFIAEHWMISSCIVLGLLLVAVFIHDVVQRRHAIIHNFPIVGHLRYLMEMVGPELRQYWVANDKEEMPFNRQERRWVYTTAKGQNSNFGFGTTEQVYGIGFPIIKHSTFPYEAPPDEDPSDVACLKVMGVAHGRRKPFHPRSIINISAMSYGSLGARATEALNRGAGLANAYHNTGEGGVSPYHRTGADVMWQLGTGYFGARTADGGLCFDTLARTCAEVESIRAIEIKLSQGAKPGKGGILPGVKVTAEIATTRGIPKGETCISPASHRAFSDVDGLIDFVEKIADCTGVPVGIKSAIGQMEFWHELADRMKTRGEGPDFISIDGGEGGTGAAPLTVSDHVALPFKVGFARVYPIFKDVGISQDIVWIGSGKLGFPDRAVIALAMGCDLIHVAREAMLSIGCIQAQRCHSDDCPAGVATQNRWLQAGLNVENKSQRAARYLEGFRKELLQLAHAAGHAHPAHFRGTDIEFSTGVNAFSTLTSVLGYERDPSPGISTSA
jgi:glutamate synthase (ferredoxin)